jgi:hypothetical protein
MPGNSFLTAGRTLAVRLHAGEQLSKEAMNATPPFSAFVSAFLLSLAEPIYGGRSISESRIFAISAPDGLLLAVTDITPPLPPFG